MTIDEAIKVLRTESVELGGNAVSVCRFWEALDMAVKALEDVTDKNVEKMTNADRIRTMSDKELAELMRSMMDCDSCGNMFSFKCDGSYEHCSSVCLKWLQQPAEEGTL